MTTSCKNKEISALLNDGLIEKKEEKNSKFS